MVCCNPSPDLLAKSLGEDEHFVRFRVRNDPGAFIVGLVSLLAIIIKRSYCGRVPSEGKLQRADDTNVMGDPRRFIAGGSEGRGRELQGGVIGDVKPPIRIQARGL